MAGRPAAPRFIVPEGDILDDNAILNENYNITLLAPDSPVALQLRAPPKYAQEPLRTGHITLEV